MAVKEERTVLQYFLDSQVFIWDQEFGGSGEIVCGKEPPNPDYWVLKALTHLQSSFKKQEGICTWGTVKWFTAVKKRGLSEDWLSLLSFWCLSGTPKQLGPLSPSMGLRYWGGEAIFCVHYTWTLDYFAFILLKIAFCVCMFETQLKGHLLFTSSWLVTLGQLCYSMQKKKIFFFK